MLYTLIAFYTLTEATYVEARHLPIQHCAGRAAMGRIAYEHVKKSVGGDVIYFCMPEKDLSK